MGSFIVFFLVFLFHSNLQTVPADTPAGTLSPTSPNHTLTVSRLGNVTLQCNITDREQVTWYLLRSYEFTLLIWAEKTRTRSSLPYHFNKNESHFVLRSDPSVNTAMMTIARLTDDDLGLYYCGTKVNFMDQIRFGKPTQLQFEDTPAVTSSPPPHTLTVSRLGNVTLQCNITDREQVTWYLLRSYELMLLIWAEKSDTGSLPYHFNKNESHFVLSSDPSVNTAMMIIIRLTDDDLGLYYCGTKVNFMDQIRFGKPTQLQFEGEDSVPASGEVVGGLSVSELAIMYGGVALSALLLFIATLIACSVIRKSKGKYHPKDDL